MFAVIGVLAKEEQLAHSQVTGGGRLDAYAQQFALKKFVGQLGEDARAITRLAVVGDGAAMGMVAKCLQPHLQDAVAAATFNMGYKANATGIMFKTRVVQPLGRGETLMKDLIRKMGDCMILQHKPFLSARHTATTTHRADALQILYANLECHPPSSRHSNMSGILRCVIEQGLR
jgi:hypothetical protein